MIECENTLQKLKSLNALFVDDEGIVIDIMQNMMPQFYKKVYFATNGVEGLSLAIKHKIDMVVTDITMPTMNGIEMVNAILKFHPEVKMIFVTGHSDYEIPFCQGRYQLIQKPLSSQKFFHAVEKIL